MDASSASGFSLSTLEAKSGLSRAKLADPFLTALYRSLAPYRGCGHGCIYCDGRAEKYYVEGDFEHHISVRENLSDRLRWDVSSGFTSREFGAICIGSGVTDVYQPIERDLGLTRKALQELVKTGLPMVILTKSDLILRDFDILSLFPKVLVITTITTVDEVDAARLEPGAASAVQRLKVISQAKAQGFFAGIMAMPLCPGICDSDESIKALLEAAVKARADFVYPGGLTLRPGRQKEAFLSLIDSSYPALRKEYDTLYRENRRSGMPLASRSAALGERLSPILRQHGIPSMIPHRVYRELLSPPDSLFVLLCHMQTLYASRGVDIRPLKKATDRYAAWLSEERTKLRRKRIPQLISDPYPISRILTEELDKGISTLTNPRLESLVKKLLDGSYHFDYPTLSPLTYPAGS